MLPSLVAAGPCPARPWIPMQSGFGVERRALVLGGLDGWLARGRRWQTDSGVG